MEDTNAHETGYERLERLVREGYIFRESVKYKGNTAYFYLISLDGSDKRNEKLEFESEDEISEMVTRLTNLMKKMYGVAFYSPKIRQEKESQEKPKSTRPITKITATMNMYDKNFADKIGILAEKENWLLKIILELGTQVLFIVIQMMDIPPYEWYDKLKEYSSNPHAFVDYADKYLVALFEAKKDAESLLELRERYKLKDAEVELWKIRYTKALKTLRDLKEDMQTLMGMLNRRQMEKYMLYLALKSASKAYDSQEAKSEE